MGVGAPHPHGPAGVGWTGVHVFLGGAPVVGPSIKSALKPYTVIHTYFNKNTPLSQVVEVAGAHTQRGAKHPYWDEKPPTREKHT